LFEKVELMMLPVKVVTYIAPPGLWELLFEKVELLMSPVKAPLTDIAPPMPVVA
jgi:hypothetical protein